MPVADMMPQSSSCPELLSPKTIHATELVGNDAVDAKEDPHAKMQHRRIIIEEAWFTRTLTKGD